MTWVDESDALHERVRSYARRALSGEPQDDSFDSLAGDLAQYQARYNPRYRRLVDATGEPLDCVDGLPSVPTEAFRLGRVAIHPPERDRAVFTTSGTTGAQVGRHALRTLETYRELAIAYGERALVCRGRPPRRVLGLARRPAAPPTSSLAFMMQSFMEAWDESDRSDERWFVDEGGIDVPGLERAVADAQADRHPVLLLATSFALVALVEGLGGRAMPLPAGSVVMPTGGFKGRSREVLPEALVEAVACALEVHPDAIVFEYGMTELSSQLYEGVLPGGALSGSRGRYLPPPWLRVSAVDPVTLRHVGPGEQGLARFVDLANVDSAVCIVTQDLVRCHDDGVEWVGRQTGSPARGCSLALEQLIP